MICIIALVVSGILAIFSATQRKIFFEACSCLFYRATFRKCKTGLDKRLKSEISGSVLAYSPKIGKIVYKYFEVFSWVLLILMFVSFFYTGKAVYNYIEYGNCNGPQSNEFCIFDPFANTQQEQVSTCTDHPTGKKTVILVPPINLSEFKSFGNINSKVTLIEFGCYTCQFTKNADKDVKKILVDYKDKIHFVFIDFPLPTHNNSIKIALAANCAYNQSKEKYLKYTTLLFDNENHVSEENLYFFATQVGLDKDQFNNCLDNKGFEEFVNDNINTAHSTQIYGTPTFFINDKSLIGPQTYKILKNAIEKELKK